ncbi:MAG: TlpA family protein disulfide reductase [Burkholderiales bacterium]|nr:TlpA family protein disulfide reductase [Burkholderiales bacterium]
MIRFALSLILALSVASHACAAGNWSLMDSAGKSVSLSDFRGKWVLVNFWATWCPGCLSEIPDLERLHRDGKLTVIGVAVSYKKRDEVLDFTKKQGITYPVVLGNEDTASRFGGLEGLPSSFLYSPQGELVGRHEGPLSGDDLAAAIRGDHPL